MFRWLSASDIPQWCDLRQCGWRLAAREASALDGGLVLALAPAMDAIAWLSVFNMPGSARRANVLLLGVADSTERARLIRFGFADVIGNDPLLCEVESRALRALDHQTMLPAERHFGVLRLDLLRRDGFVGQRAIGLHPREFALIWRLAESPGIGVSKRRLLADVWQMGFVPETNSLAVHVFRLRAKLAAAGIQDLVETDAETGYRLAVWQGLDMGPSPRERLAIGIDQDIHHEA